MPLTVCSQHEGLPAAAAYPAAGAGESQVPHPFSWGMGMTRHDLTREACCRRPTVSTVWSIAVPCCGNRRFWARAGSLSPQHPPYPAGE